MCNIIVRAIYFKVMGSKFWKNANFDIFLKKFLCHNLFELERNENKFWITRVIICRTYCNIKHHTLETRNYAKNFKFFWFCHFFLKKFLSHLLLSSCWMFYWSLWLVSLSHAKHFKQYFLQYLLWQVTSDTVAPSHDCLRDITRVTSTTPSSANQTRRWFTPVLRTSHGSGKNWVIVLLYCSIYMLKQYQQNWITCKLPYSS